MGLIQRLPWWTKVGAKLALARMPVPYRFWRKLGFFRHGDMNCPRRALTTFQGYFDRAREVRALPQGFTVLELGPGDSVLAGLAARAHGAGRVWLLDAGAYADTDVRRCKTAADLLRAQGANPLDLDGCVDLAEVLQRNNIAYLTEGVAAFGRIPAASVDFFWSQVVLEHVPAPDFDVLLQQLRRVVKNDAVGIHSVDFRDHLGGGLNHLRFGARVWESDLFRRSGFYTNRIRCNEMVTRFEAAGFAVCVLREMRWPHLPLPRARMAAPFRNCPEDVLSVAEAELLIRPKA
jgi:SAM-dependent methyltransferase